VEPAAKTKSGLSETMRSRLGSKPPPTEGKRLTESGLPYATLWGSLDERLEQALHALKQPLGLDLADGPERDSQRTWRCEHCADPASEHRLFGFCPRA
jgi:hypothetical protein